MCRKHQRHCRELEAVAGQTLREWAEADSLEAVRACWGRKGGKTTLHRYGQRFFVLIGRRRHGDPQALGLQAAHMQRRREVAR
jgi:hypothetical protein